MKIIEFVKASKNLFTCDYSHKNIMLASYFKLNGIQATIHIERNLAGFDDFVEDLCKLELRIGKATLNRTDLYLTWYNKIRRRF